MLRVGVLASGTGSLFEAILAGQDDRYQVAVLVTDRPGIRAIELAEVAGVPAIVHPFKSFADRDAFSAAVAASLLEHRVDLVAQAGFMRILTAPFLEATRELVVLNSHPSLLPKHPGAHGVRDTLEAGDEVAGTTIHHVTADLDAGPIVAQAQVPIEPGDTEASLHERIKLVEQRLYPDVIRSFAGKGAIAPAR